MAFFEQKIRIRRKAGSAIVIIAVLAGVILIGYFVIARLVTEAAGFVASLPSIWQDIEKELNEVMGSLEALYDRFPSALKENLTQIGDNLGSYISSAINGLSEPTVNAVGNIARKRPPAARNRAAGGDRLRSGAYLSAGCCRGP